MQNSWLSLLPPLIVLASALLTKRILTSLFLGIFASAFIATDFLPIATLKSVFSHIFDQFTDIDNFFFFGLIFTLGIIISLINKTGGAQAIGEIIIRKSKSIKTTESSSLILSMCLFIDDYLNSLTTGHVMRPITDKFGIPRVKLAFLTGIMSGSLAILVPISTWLGIIIAQLSTAGISLDPFYKPVILSDPFFVYLKSVPFILYPIIIIFSAWFIVRKKISFGPMHTQEEIARTTGNLFGGKTPIISKLDISHSQHNSISDFLLPLLTLIGLILIGIPYSGGFYLLGGKNTLIQAFQSANTPLILFVAGIVSLITTIVFALIRNKIKINNLPGITKSGIQMMLSSVALILLALIFGSFLKQDLKTGQYLADLLMGSINISFVPLMIFLTSTAISLAIGSSWGTMAILIPIIIPMLISLLNLQPPIALENINVLFPCLGAIFSGAIAGNHLSPISDSTIMASSSAGAYAIDLIKVRFYYVLPAIISACAAFLTVGLLIKQNYNLALFGSLIVGILLVCFILMLCQKLFNKKN